MDTPPLDQRKQQILKAVVADYTLTGVPVGSQALAARHLVSWSSATIRNELASLVDIGYLVQPHTSAGRVPSDRGYRYYVDFLMEEEPVSLAIKRHVDTGLPPHPASLEELLEATAMVLALVTEAVGLVTGPAALTARIKHLDVVSLDARHALLVVLLEGNLLRQHVVDLARDADQGELSTLAVLLNAELVGLGADQIPVEVTGADGAVGPSPSLRSVISSELQALLRSLDEHADTVVLHDGVRNLIREPEFGDVERLQSVLAILEEERVLGRVLAAVAAGGDVQVLIGTENEVEQLQRCSLVLATYRAGPGRRGTIGVLGPTRMRYPHIAARLRYLAQRVGTAAEQLLG